MTSVSRPKVISPSSSPSPPGGSPQSIAILLVHPVLLRLHNMLHACQQQISGGTIRPERERQHYNIRRPLRHCQPVKDTWQIWLPRMAQQTLFRQVISSYCSIDSPICWNTTQFYMFIGTGGLSRANCFVKIYDTLYVVLHMNTDSSVLIYARI